MATLSQPASFDLKCRWEVARVCDAVGRGESRSGVALSKLAGPVSKALYCLVRHRIVEAKQGRSGSFDVEA
eukprot:6470703-Pyramimonas_sp.AAC.1